MGFELLEPRELLAAFDVLVFSKTAGFRHDSISAGIAAIQALGAANDFPSSRRKTPRSLPRPTWRSSRP
jgi:hypothetical protein